MWTIRQSIYGSTHADKRCVVSIFQNCDAPVEGPQSEVY